MTIYVDELPKSCWNCPCAIKSQRQQFKDKERMMDTFMEDCMHCIPLDKWIVEKHKNCPLQSLADYTKQVRKEVLEKVYKVLEQAVPKDLSWAVIKKELGNLNYD